MQTDKEYTAERSLLGIYSESTGEYPLPDYNGDVKRVIMINPRVVPNGKFIGESSVEFSGTVFYDVVYLDSENNVSRAEFSTDYDVAVKTDSEVYGDSYITTALSSYNVRLLGPRKFSAKCSLVSDVRIMEKRTLEIMGDGFEGKEPETLTASANVMVPIFREGTAVECKEELLVLEGAIEDEVSVLLCDVKSDIPSVSPDGEGAEVKSDLTVTLLYKNYTSPISTKTLKIPYAGRVEGDGLGECVSLYGRIDVTSLKTEVLPTEDGVTVNAVFTLTPAVRGLTNGQLELVTDSYLKEQGTANEYSDFSYSEHICTESAEGEASARVALSELTDAPVSSFVYVNSVAHVDECEIQNGGVHIKGEIRISGIAYGEADGGEENYSNLKINVPFEENVNISCQIHDNMRVECHVSVFDEKIEITDDNLFASCSLSILVTLNSQKKQRCLGASYLSGEEYEKETSVVTVYYPDDKESLFDIAKRFHTSVQRIAEDNALSQSAFASSDSPVKSFGYKKILIK